MSLRFVGDFFHTTNVDQDEGKWSKKEFIPGGIDALNYKPRMGLTIVSTENEARFQVKKRNKPGEFDTLILTNKEVAIPVEEWEELTVGDPHFSERRGPEPKSATQANPFVDHKFVTVKADFNAKRRVLIKNWLFRVRQIPKWLQKNINDSLRIAYQKERAAEIKQVQNAATNSEDEYEEEVLLDSEQEEDPPEQFEDQEEEQKEDPEETESEEEDPPAPAANRQSKFRKVKKKGVQCQQCTGETLKHEPCQNVASCRKKSRAYCWLHIPNE